MYYLYGNDVPYSDFTLKSNLSNIVSYNIFLELANYPNASIAQLVRACGC